MSRYSSISMAPTSCRAQSQGITRLETRRLVFLYVIVVIPPEPRTQELERPASAKNHRAQLTQYLTPHRISWELPAAIILNCKCFHIHCQRGLSHTDPRATTGQSPWSWCCSGSGSLEDADMTGQPLRGTWG